MKLPRKPLRRVFTPTVAALDQAVSALTNFLPALLATRIGADALTIYGTAATWMVVAIALTHASVGEFVLWGGGSTSRSPMDLGGALSTAVLVGGAVSFLAVASTTVVVSSRSATGATVLLVLGSATTVPLRSAALHARRLLTLLLSDILWLVATLAAVILPASEVGPILGWALGAILSSGFLVVKLPEATRGVSRPLFSRSHSGPLVAEFAVNGLLIQLTSLLLVYGSRPSDLGALRAGLATLGPAGALRTALSNVYVSRRGSTGAGVGERREFLIGTFAAVWVLSLSLGAALMLVGGLGEMIFSGSWGRVRSLIPLIILVGSLEASATAVVSILRRAGDTRRILSTRGRLIPLALAAPLGGLVVGGIYGLLVGRAVFHLIEVVVWFRAVRNERISESAVRSELV